ncbi:DUF302 domain-containing protein [Vibrio splendidus]|uniref:DUF302 domain-containing protein n=1 Tax=Vibrio splendidus TaxID=29497 RepID=UPI000D332419|nr:DUF302 domain-containing protein [Vibrio splendidus]PTP55284.1 hypothetical protein CWO05_07160 [Vibrio splendidus]
MKNRSLMMLLALPLMGCESTVDPIAYVSDLQAVDQNALTVEANVQGQSLDHVLTIDHSRLAEQAGEYLAPSRVDFYTNDALNTALLKLNPEVGLDLPFRVLNYMEGGIQKTAYTDAEFIRKRHGITDDATLTQYQLQIERLVRGLDNASAVNSDTLDQGYGIEALESDYDFETTLKNIKRDVLEQDDTVWFMNWDYKARAESIGQSLPKATLLVFGGPVPGATAMTDFPSIGLDAFGQKVLVIEQEGKVIVLYNDIVDMSELHYGDNAISHKIINFRLSKTLGGAVSK